MLIENGNIDPTSLAGKVAIVTGAGGGIGYEAARALLWLGAKVVIAEIHKAKGKLAEKQLSGEFGAGSVVFVQTDVGNKKSVKKLKTNAIKSFGKVDIIINNATVAPVGAIKDVGVENWDESYEVNLRGPVLMARTFIPEMISREYGVFVCVSSTGQAFMAAYEAIKAAQVHLGSTLAEELEGSGVHAFIIGPGYVPTRTAEESIPKLATMMEKPIEELLSIVKQYELSVEAAGAGFAAAVVLAETYIGQEISSTQALIDAGIALEQNESVDSTTHLSVDDFVSALELCKRVRITLQEQSDGWKERSIFERQWMIRFFRKQAGMPVEQWLEVLDRLEQALTSQDTNAVSLIQVRFDLLVGFYANLYEMTKGYIKDVNQRTEQLAIVKGWLDDVDKLSSYLC